MIIRRAKKEDREDIWRVQTESTRQAAIGYYSSEQIEAWAALPTPAEGYLQSIEESVYLVAEASGGEIAGFAHVDEQTGEVGALYAAPTYIGHGVGRQLLEAVEEAARRAGITRLHLRASLNALAFYGHMGFEIDREIIHRFRSGIEIPCAMMSKSLADS